MLSTTCRNCNCTINLNFCPNCGHPATLRRIDRHYIIHEIRDFFFANKGMIYTVKKVLISPGKSVRSFIAEDRFRFVKPITFLFITSLIYTFVHYIFDFGQEVYNLGFEEGTTVYKIYDWLIIRYPGYGNLMVGFFVAFFVKLFFRKVGYNLLEVFILFCFMSGISSLFMSIVTIIQGITQWNILQFAAYVTVIYYVWAIGQFFSLPQFSIGKKIGNYAKAFLSFMFGSTVVTFIIVVIGTIIDELAKY